MDHEKYISLQKEQNTSSSHHMAWSAKHVIQAEAMHPQLSQRALSDPRSLSPNDVRMLQRTIGNRAVAQLLQGKLESTQNSENVTGMPDALKAGIESLSGMSMDDVKVHYHSAKPAQLQALSYTQGPDIYVGPAQEKHLAHEAWHVVQQKQGRVQPTFQMKGEAINSDPELEKEADMMGQKAEYEQPVQHSRTTGNGRAQRICHECEEELEQGQGPVQGKWVIQRYTDCSASNHYTDRYHHWIQKRYQARFGNSAAEYSVLDSNDAWNFIDIVDLQDEEVYEIKSANQGAAKAAAEAQFYVNLLKSAYGCQAPGKKKKNWKLGRTFDKVWHTEGGGERLEAWCPQDGAILYSIENIDLTSESGSEMSESE